MPKARVVVCVPAQGTWMDAVGFCYGDLRETCALNDVAVIGEGFRSSMISLSRNTLTRAAFRYDFTHILWIDSDNTFPRDGLLRLLDHDKDVVGSFYSKKTPPYTTVGHLIPPVTDADIAKGGIFRADLMPMGFCLVKRRVYEDVLKAPWYYESFDPTIVSETDPDGVVSEDANFSRNCVAAGIEMWCDADLSFEMGHIGLINVPCARPKLAEAAATSLQVVAPNVEAEAQAA